MQELSPLPEGSICKFCENNSTCTAVSTVLLPPVEDCFLIGEKYVDTGSLAEKCPRCLYGTLTLSPYTTMSFGIEGLSLKEVLDIQCPDCRASWRKDADEDESALFNFRPEGSDAPPDTKDGLFSI